MAALSGKIAWVTGGGSGIGQGAAVRAPPHRPAIVDLLGRRLGVFPELDFRHGHQAGERHADGAADDALLVE